MELMDFCVYDNFFKYFLDCYCFMLLILQSRLDKFCSSETIFANIFALSH